MPYEYSTRDELSWSSLARAARASLRGITPSVRVEGVLSMTGMRARVPLSRAASFPVTVGVALLAIAFCGCSERCWKLSPSEPTLWFNLGIAYQREQRLGDARRAYQRAAQLKPGDGMYRETAEMIPAGVR